MHPGDAGVGVPVKIVVVGGAKGRVPERLRRELYRVLEKSAVKTPLGWVLVSENEKVLKTLSAVSAQAPGAVEVVEVTVPEEFAKRHLPGWVLSRIKSSGRLVTA